MATPSSNRTGDTMPNHHPISTQGGASAIPTAANNTGGGSGWGDEGFIKGGGGEKREESDGSCVSGDHSFAKHTPGCPQGMTGKITDFIHTIHGQGR
ncbi:conserved hypothetical protein [Talaromyces stipitatus ATCC 10500]|uniref:Uncharacterized protein n=1 Tax=Talaromyces stipitatus (strain ATCC 10500 / CBS 375.48 / QM 6759 / NRRL 1006) TaxID=441959 RepID=B8MFK1_TALSN|nr:uncharacterized protein TSTA_020490 [Talaromyces stipitatus ATCC 10500]XP_002484226.1 uncharacterized protein TSTA_020490 [Talaromyces stipitatus ATCC 10500]EED16991.1 conserved hypothetical protein [Talaromyces stipitatus ATCC 10500]EED16992.1 conserved hypothetical protein [Talaromyces stipitatus ATCC 10500]